MSANSTAQLGADFVSGILSYLDVTARVTASDAGDGNITVRLEGDTQGFAAKTDLVAAIAQLAGQAVSTSTQSRARVVIDFGGGKSVAAPGPAPSQAAPPRAPAPPKVKVSDARDEFLGDLAAEIADIVARTGRRAVIEGLASPERRIVHTVLMDQGDVNTHSEGSENNRYLLVEPSR